MGIQKKGLNSPNFRDALKNKRRQMRTLHTRDTLHVFLGHNALQLFAQR